MLASRPHIPKQTQNPKASPLAALRASGVSEHPGKALGRALSKGGRFALTTRQRANASM